MTSLRFLLKLSQREPFVKRDELNMLSGGLQIIIDDALITKYTDEEQDPGFRGGLIYYILFSCLSCIPRLFSGEKSKAQTMTSGGLFIFTPRGNLTYVMFSDFDPDLDFKNHVIGIVKDGKQITVSCDSQNRRYPNFPLGTPVPTELIAKEIVRVGDEFLRHLESMKESPDEHIDKFRVCLNETKRFMDVHLRN